MNTLFSTILETPVGKLAITGTESAVISVLFREEGRVPESAELPPNMLLARQEFEAYFAGTLQEFTFIIGQEGTDFQKKVWEELMFIPFGDTASYLDMAKRLGDEKVIRAAASANGQNKIAIAVPCHRVIGSSGKLTGYAGGLWRKQWLLDHEKKVTGRFDRLF